MSFAKAADDEMRSERGRQATNVGSVRKRPKNFRQGAVKLSESVVSNGCGLASVCRESAAERKGGDVADARRDCHVTYKGSGAGKLLLSVGIGRPPPAVFVLLEGSPPTGSCVPLIEVADGEAVAAPGTLGRLSASAEIVEAGRAAAVEGLSTAVDNSAALPSVLAASLGPVSSSSASCCRLASRR